ncbi:4-(cytidine 5'-diphospho)-2-C-methyl-D-erythritol kinase [Methyloraptor flagellatus]|uniref:4-(Cytidine 5'-diphospho)-2-C-methyl-D-erythritol kinase n=1 Tax=Methyloraptor flagellatus TaxID=3162530 RepID=A0AAU7X585_9HYPH
MLDKRLPVAAGIGGGSADAAATLRLLDDLLGLDLGLEVLCRLGLALGADVPMCLHGATARVGGIGEDVQHLAPLPEFGLLLVNPGVALATPAVFKILESRHNPRLPLLPERFADCMHLARWLADTRNDLEPPAIRLVPVVAAVHAALAAEADCLFARMSGSGATSFGLFPSRQAAIEAGRRLAVRHPDWWIAADF